MEPILKIDRLKTSFMTSNGEVQAVRGVSFSVHKGEILGIVGESGSGKSVTSMSILRLLADTARIKEGTIIFDGQDLTKLSKKAIRKIRGEKISMIFQEPMTSLNPVKRIGWQVEESLRIHKPDMDKQERYRRAIKVLSDVELENPELVYKKYPHELSGGMRQRVMIASAMICEPKLLIADEPTTALDVTIQLQIVKLLQRLNKEKNTAILFISHDLSLVKRLCDRIIVMHNGSMVENGRTEDIFRNPQKEYTRELINAIPRLEKLKDS